MPELLSAIDANPKVAKNGKLGEITAVLHLAPAGVSGYQVCQYRSPGCEAACLHFAGAALYQSRKEQARIRKTRLFFENRALFMSQLVKDINWFRGVAKRKGMRPSVRLNGTSDLPWERIRCGDADNILALFPDVLFYDYTAIPNRVVPDNYHLTFSLKENNEALAREAVKQGLNLAVVFFDSGLPSSFWDLPVIDGDETDFRPADPTPCIVGLKAKGPKGKADMTGFIHGKTNT